MTSVQPSMSDRLTKPVLNALVASRICHDLVGPLGAIANGLELLALTGRTSPEAELIADSVASATARLRFFRVAFGLSGSEQMMSRGEITSILQAVARGGRISYNWEPPGECMRHHVRPIFLLLQCMETAMPSGGRVNVNRRGSTWTVTGESDRLRVDQAAWLSLTDQDADTPVAPALVHFALLPHQMTELGRSLRITLQAARIEAEF